MKVYVSNHKNIEAFIKNVEFQVGQHWRKSKMFQDGRRSLDLVSHINLMMLKKHNLGGNPRIWLVFALAFSLHLNICIIWGKGAGGKIVATNWQLIATIQPPLLDVLRFHTFAMAKRDLALVNGSLSLKVGIVSHFTLAERDRRNWLTKARLSLPVSSLW